ncbi:hypothetical protein AXG93_1054s1150 [Marchantia polymorpha subsp. ruderalis]|nr:hypothetical protein AXG93_1054s1150 [Marchantia polymorpha subsp. ruderalis]
MIEANFCTQINPEAQRALKPKCKISSIGSSFMSGNQQRMKEEVRFSRLKASDRVVHHVQAGTRPPAHNSQMHTLELLRQGLLGQHPEAAQLREVAALDLNCLTEAAAEVRDRRQHASIVTFSPKVFIPLTRVCRDVCGYCTFSLGPKPGQAVYLTIEEVLNIARAGAAAGCSEALFTLGDKPELVYPQAKFELAAMGYATTIDYVAEAARLVLEETGLLPHINAGVMERDDVAKLRRFSVSQGLMLESISERLMEPGGPHFNSPDKNPAARLATIEAAGEEKVPFTSGLLIGIGETREERLDSLFALRELHLKYGHIQELIIQNFRAKKGTRMANAPEPPLEELTWTVAMARLTFGSAMSIQAPPNLTPNVHLEDESSWRALIASGINDWGGVSPVTIDWVNPEAPWPHLETLSAATSESGKSLVPRLPLYPEYIRQAATWVEPSIMKSVLRSSNSLGYARAESWSPGIAMDESTIAYSYQGSVAVENDGTMKVSRPTTGGLRTGSSEITELVQRAQIGEQLAELEITKLLEAVGPDFEYIRSAADALRSRVNGDEVSYVVNRNINYTNVCSYRCQFCAFSKGKTNEELRGKPYRLSLEEIARRSIEAWERGATEVCMQGGIHPEFTGETYLDILNTVRKAAPKIHVHAFSPLEVFQGASTLGISLEEYLKELKKAGLGSLPGTAAEVLDEEVRSVLCPDKINTRQWLEIMETAHSVGLRTTSTIMFGHLDRPYHWARHLLHVRNLQMRTGGFTEFVPLPFVHMEAPVFLKGRARKGPTMRDCIIMHSVARLVLYPHITNIQASWVKMGPGGVKTLLAAGCNDMGGSLMNESITRAAGASYGEELPPHEMERVILASGRRPRQRTTLYGEAPAEQAQRSFGAKPLVPIR